MSRLPSYIDLTTIAPVVVDNGGGYIKAGVATDFKTSTRKGPPVKFPTFIGVSGPKGEDAPAEGAEGATGEGGGAAEAGSSMYVGDDAWARRQELESTLRPIQGGHVQDWDAMEHVWRYMYKDKLRMKSKRRPVLLSEAPRVPVEDRKTMAEIFFEGFDVPAMYLWSHTALALYSFGRLTSVGVDIGWDGTWVVPIHDGHVLRAAVQRVPLGGRDVTEQLGLLLAESTGAAGTTGRSMGGDLRLGASGLPSGRVGAPAVPSPLGPGGEGAGAGAAGAGTPGEVSSPFEGDFGGALTWDAVRGAKEASCTVAGVFDQELRRYADNAAGGYKDSRLRHSFVLPDGNSINLRASSFRASEILFAPERVCMPGSTTARVLDTPAAAPDPTAALASARTALSVLSGGSSPSGAGGAAASSAGAGAGAGAGSRLGAGTGSVLGSMASSRVGSTARTLGPRGILQATLKSISTCSDIERKLYRNVVLTGGTTMIPGMRERLQHGLTMYSPERTKVTVRAPLNRGYAAWVGGSMVSSLSTFKDMWVTREQYEETGSHIIIRKCTG